MNKDFKYYMALNYPVEISKISEADGGGYFASIPLLSGCMSDGETIEDAYENIEYAKREWIQSMLDRNLVIPEPNAENKFSGRFMIRIPKTLHKLLSEQSKKEGISLNQYVANSLAFVAGHKTVM